jgi:hypothetical protein
MAGTMDKVKGAAKDAVGSATGNTRMQAEGKMDKARAMPRTWPTGWIRAPIRSAKPPRASKTA